MNEHDMDPKLRSWARSRGDRPAPAELGRRVLDIPTDETTSPQRRRWLWFLPGPKPTAGADDQGHSTQPTAPTTPTRELRLTPIGGTRTMFSATKLVAAAAVAAPSGALLLAGPFTTRPAEDPVEPTANTNDSAVFTLVSGQMPDLTKDDQGASQTHDWGYLITDRLWTTTFELSDERPARVRSNFHALEWDWQGAHSIFHENDGGSWVGTGRSYLDPAATEGGLGAGQHMHFALQGQEGYEGLNAILAIDQAASDQPFEVTGAVTPFALPSMPGPAPTTFVSDG